MNIKERLYVATMAEDAAQMAAKYGIGIEIDEFCTASNMEGESFGRLDRIVKEKIKGIDRCVLHAPFNELFPSAIDPLARELAYRRYHQAFELTQRYGIHRMVVHSGFVPFVYFRSWFQERSVEFWKSFMDDKPEEFCILIENVLEEDPYTLAGLIEKTGDRRIRACLDIGHAHFVTKVNLTEWVETLGPYLGHVHLHNNYGESDSHDALGRGDIDINEILHQVEHFSSGEVTYTIENMKCEESLKWLSKNEWIPQL